MQSNLGCKHYLVTDPPRLHPFTNKLLRRFILTIRSELNTCHGGRFPDYSLAIGSVDEISSHVIVRVKELEARLFVH